MLDSVGEFCFQHFFKIIGVLGALYFLCHWCGAYFEGRKPRFEWHAVQPAQRDAFLLGHPGLIAAQDLIAALCREDGVAGLKAAQADVDSLSKANPGMLLFARILN